MERRKKEKDSGGGIFHASSVWKTVSVGSSATSSRVGDLLKGEWNRRKREKNAQPTQAEKVAEVLVTSGLCSL